MNSFLKISILLLTISSLLCACQLEYVELKTIETEPLSISSDDVFSKEVIDTPTINFDEVFNPTTKAYEPTDAGEYSDADTYIEEIEGMYLASDSEVTPVEESASSIESVESMETTDESQQAPIEEAVSTMSNITILDLSKEADDRIYSGEINVNLTDSWKYGRTPCEWVFVEPNIQLVSNYRPNSSAKYSIKKRVSSGSKGCYIPVFSETEMKGDTYEARFFVYEDYSKTKPDDMEFSNTLDSLTYEGKSVEEILKSKMKLSETKNGLLVDEGIYINIVYVTDLDRILASK